MNNVIVKLLQGGIFSCDFDRFALIAEREMISSENEDREIGGELLQCNVLSGIKYYWFCQLSMS